MLLELIISKKKEINLTLGYILILNIVHSALRKQTCCFCCCLVKCLLKDTFLLLSAPLSYLSNKNVFSRNYTKKNFTILLPYSK